jgi:nucleoside-diphosphate-sugar epimerase
MARLIVGCGYLGRRVAKLWAVEGDIVHVLTRSQDRATQLQAEGYRPLIGDVTDPSTLMALPQVDTVLWAVGHDRQSGQSIFEVYADGFRNLLASLADGTLRIVYISSTGVYGQQDGGWVDEDSPCEPRRAGGQACLAAEQLLLASPWSSRAVILRLAGIYGPQRLPRLQQLRSGEPLRSDPHGVINLIHVDDAAAAVVRVAELPLPLPRTFLIADGHPVARRAFYEELARQASTPPPLFDPAGASAGEANRSGSHKRVANDRMIRELGLELRFPTYREGVAAVGP